MLQSRAESRDSPENVAARAHAASRNRAFLERAAARRAEAASIDVATDGLLKLMLILLAFFVVLYSRSEASAIRAWPVLEALADRFAAPVVDDAGAEPEDGSSRAEERLRRRLAASLPVQARVRQLPGMLIAFDLDATDLFEDSGSTVRRERLVLLRRLAMELAGRGEGWGSPLTITTLAPERAAGTARERLVALADVLETNGLAVGMLRLGFAELPADAWRFTVPRAQLSSLDAD